MYLWNLAVFDQSAKLTRHSFVNHLDLNGDDGGGVRLGRMQRWSAVWLLKATKLTDQLMLWHWLRLLQMYYSHCFVEASMNQKDFFQMPAEPVQLVAA